MKTAPTLDGYFAEASAWDHDRVAVARRSVRSAWWVAAAGWICAMTCGVALMLLAPLKSVEPFVIRVDRSTGIVDVVPVYAGHATQPEAVTRYFLAHYVTVCERFDYATAQSDYAECGAFQTPEENQAWYALWNRANPASPLNLHKDGSTVEARVESINFLAPFGGLTKIAQVRYLTFTRPAGGAGREVAHFVVTVRYRYDEPSADPMIRRWNPLGFKVVDFRPEPELFTEPPPAQRAPQGPDAGPKP